VMARFRLGTGLAAAVVAIALVAGTPAPAMAPATTAPYTAPDGTQVAVGTAVEVINEDDIELPVHCLASPSGSCVFDGGGLYKPSGLVLFQPLTRAEVETAAVAEGGESLDSLFHPGAPPAPLEVPVGGSGTTLFSLEAPNRRGYERFLHLGAVAVGMDVCARAPCLITTAVVVNPELPPVMESNGAPNVDVGTVPLDVSQAEPSPPTYVYLSRLTVRHDGEATISLRCTSSPLLRGSCIVTDFVAEPAGSRMDRKYSLLFLRKSLVIPRGGETTTRLYYWRAHQPAGSPVPSAFQYNTWSNVTQADISVDVCSSSRRGCHASSFNAYGSSEVTAELMQRGPPELPSHMTVWRGE
jgi:hypothetical protein